MRAALAVFVAAAAAGAAAAADAPGWPENVSPLARPWQPADKFVSQQNPPDFAWPAVKGVTAYDLQVCLDPAGREVAYTAEDLARNFHNFGETFMPGSYYWRVRYRTADAVSAWSAPRRFRIEAAAWPFPVPAANELMRRIPAEHPRVWVTRAGLAEFRARADGPRKEWFAGVLARVRAELPTPLPPEPTFPYAPDGPRTPEWLAAHLQLRAHAWDGYGGAAVRLLRTAFCYLVTGDTAIGRNAVAQMLNFRAWDPQGPTGYKTHDQVHRAIALYSAMAYDWCHDVMTPGERDEVLALIRERTDAMAQRMMRRPLNEMPFDSHAWTAFGYVGVIAIATLGDLPEARDWFTMTIPAYINVLPPWGGEDGGWAQGISYWQYSQRANRALADALWPATGFSLYDKAFFRNNAYFPLYVFPHGSPRSHFGDGNEYRPANHSISHLRRLAQVYRDPVLQWAWQAIGDAPPDQHDDYLGGDLAAYFSGDDTLPARPPPATMPRARWYRDIDWVAMHSDLADPRRVSFYFKSSPFGSFNHSHADQNSFVLNAHGEALAIDAGYYDAYGTPHDTRFTRQTLAHNAITHDGGRGQPIFDLEARGRIHGFVTTADVDACTGDATAAYKGALGRAVRHVIYLRPDTFVLIDELGAAAGKRARFEWWLHALQDIALDRDQAGATLTQGQAALRVRFPQPAGLIAAKRTEFIGPPGAYAPAEPIAPVPPQPQMLGDQGTASQVHAWFSTPALESTVIVAILQVARRGVTPPAVASRRTGRALELTFAGGARVWVRLSGAEVSAGGVRFRGAAAALVGETLLLVDGDRLEQRGGASLETSLPVIAAVRRDGRAEISARDDTRVTLAGGGQRPARLTIESGTTSFHPDQRQDARR